MAPKTRRIVLGVVAVLLIGGFGYWWYSGFSLGFMRFFASEDLNVVSRSLGISPRLSRSPLPSPAVPGMVTCLPATQTVTVGQGATVTATGGTGGAYKWFAPGGTISAANQIGFSPPEAKVITYTTPGVKKVTVESPRSAGSQGTNTTDGNQSGSATGDANAQAFVDSIACTIIVN